MQRMGRNQKICIEQLKALETVFGVHKWFIKSELPYVTYNVLNSLVDKGFLEAKTIEITLPVFQRPNPGRRALTQTYLKRYYHRVLDWPTDYDKPLLEYTVKLWDPSMLPAGWP
ncbi:hypothetical protein KAR91_80420 [Candidatus Pacearchaeota archaeon]|nr:hypothetical protein [Candidatus Pacearchaeota archaeon]